MRGWLVGGMAILLASTLVGAGGAAVGAEEDGGGEGWARLGPPGPRRIGIVAVATGWPEDHVILAVGGEDAIRSMDGGGSWERLARPPGSVWSLALARASRV